MLELVYTVYNQSTTNGAKCQSPILISLPIRHLNVVEWYHLNNGGAGKVITYANVWGDPHFVNPAAGDYHIRPDSAAVDAGARYYVVADFDGTLRPIGLPDIGADEWGTRMFLPLVLK